LHLTGSPLASEVAPKKVIYRNRVKLYIFQSDSYGLFA
jgi:hypothetical protein